MRVFVDANIFMYAVGAAHPYKAPSIQLLERIAADEMEAVNNAEALQELLYRYWSINRLQEGLALCEQALRVIPTILPVGASDVLVAKQLLAEHRTIEPRDAIHAAVMFNHGITHLYSYDRHFDKIPGLKRLEPGLNR